MYESNVVLNTQKFKKAWFLYNPRKQRVNDIQP